MILPYIYTSFYLCIVMIHRPICLLFYFAAYFCLFFREGKSSRLYILEYLRTNKSIKNYDYSLLTFEQHLDFLFALSSIKVQKKNVP